MLLAKILKQEGFGFPNYFQEILQDGFYEIKNESLFVAKIKIFE